jgi:hypothetical protein
MSSTQALNAQPVVILSDDGGGVALDATVTQTHSGSQTITEHPVEVGANVTDHSLKDPDKLQLQGIVSDYPILRDINAGPEPAIIGGDPDRRAQQAYLELVRFKNEARLLQVVTELRDYSDLMIESVSVAKDKSRRHVLDITIGLKEFRKASVETVDAPEPVEPVHKSRRNQGRKPKKRPATQVEEKADSILSSVADSFDRQRGEGGLFGSLL